MYIYFLFILFIFSNLENNILDNKKTLKLSLSKAINMMLNSNTDLKASKSNLIYAHNRLREVNSYRYPKLEAFVNLAPTPKSTGDHIDSTRDWSTWGSYLSFGGKLVQPLYTFGLIDSYEDAAISNLEHERDKFKLKKSEKILLIKKYYYGYQLANDLALIAEDGKKKFDEAISVSNDLLLKRKIKKEDIYQLKIAFSSFMDKYLESYRKKDLALLGIKWLLSVPYETEIIFDEESIIPVDIDLENESYYLDLSLKNRPELKMLSSGVNAYNSLLNVEKHKRYPLLYLALSGSISRTNVIEDQTSTFAYDPYNRMGGAIMFGLKFNLSWWQNDPLINQAKAKQEFMNYEKIYKSEAIVLELKKIYREAIDSKKSLDYSLDGEKNANKWNFNATLAYSFGNIKSKEMLDAIKALLEAKLSFNKAIYEYNMSIARLSKICNTELFEELDY